MSPAALKGRASMIRIGDAMEVVRGASPRPKGDPKYFGGDIPWIMISDVTRVHGKYLSETRESVTRAGADRSRYLRAGTLILSNSGTVCVPKILAVDGCIHDGFIAFPSLPPYIDKHYLYWFFEHIRPSIIEANRQGITQVNLNTGIVRNIEIPVVAIEEQRRVVADIEKQFSRLDEAVANLKRVKANLKRFEAAVLKAAIEGGLVPTEAELAQSEGRTYETGAQLLQRALTARRSQWPGKGRYAVPAQPDGADHLRLPKGWARATIDQLGFIQLGRQRSPKNVSKDHPVKYIRAANITEAGLDLSDVLHMDFNPAEQERYRLMRGDLVLSEASGSPEQVGKPAVWREEIPLCCFQNTVIRLRPSLDMSPFLFTCFRAFYVNGVFARVAGGVGINHLGAEKFSNMCVAVPPLPEQRRIVAEVDRRLSIAREVKAEVDASLKRAQALRQRVLLRAFSMNSSEFCGGQGATSG